MLEYITNTLQEVASQPIGLVFALILGVVSAAASLCCTLPAMGMLIGYSGTRSDESRKAVVKSALLFTVGTMLALMIVGGIAGFIGQTAQAALGRYWKLFAGIVAVFLGVATLNLLPFKLSFGKLENVRPRAGTYKMALAGLVLGGFVAICSLPCNPGIFIVIGAAILQGKVFWAAFLMAMFALGFSIPLGAVLLGVSMGRFSLAARGMDKAFRWTAGLILTVAGFYFLISF